MKNIIKTTQRRLSIKANEYIPTVQGYAPEFEEPKPKQRFYRKEFEKLAINVSKKEIGRKKYMIMEYNSQEDSLNKPYSKFPKKRFRQQLSEVRLMYKAELAEKERDKREALIVKEEEQKNKDLNVKEYQARKTKEYNEILEQDSQSFTHIEDVIFKNQPLINKEEKILFHKIEVKEMRIKRREALFEEKKMARLTQLLNLFYLAASFVTPDNIDQVIEDAFESPISLSKDVGLVNVEERKKQIYDVMNDTINEKPGVKEIMQINLLNNKSS